MTREQDFERRLAEWLDDGPSTAPIEAVDRALERTAGRRQRRGPWRWLDIPWRYLGHGSRTRGLARAIPVAAVLVGLLLTSLLVSLPFAGGPGPTPGMDASEIYVVAGPVRTESETGAPERLTRSIHFEVGDPRVDGKASQVLEVALDTETGLRIARGTMRLENAWGAWEGTVDVIAYPNGEEVEVAALSGSDAYDGFIYHYSIHDQPAGAERTVEGAIWPDEPPAMPDPSLLP